MLHIINEEETLYLQWISSPSKIVPPFGNWEVVGGFELVGQ